MIDWVKKNLPFLLILFLLVLFAYSISTFNEFISDDVTEIKDNPAISSLSTVLKSPYGVIRPTLYWVSYHIFGLEPASFRLINFFFHTANVWLIFAVLMALKVSKKPSLFISGIFAVHPAISEGVFWISGGNYAQYSFFFLVSFLIFIFSKGRKSFYPLSATFYLLSFMSHPVMPLGLFLLFALYEYIYGDLKANWVKILPFLGVAIVYLLINLGALSEREHTLQTTLYINRGVDNIFVLIPTAISSYLELIFFPKSLTFYHTEIDFSPIELLLRTFLSLGYFCLLVFTFFKQKKLFFPLALFFLALLPTLSPYRLNWPVAERYSYLAILGIIVPVVLLVDKFLASFKVKYLTFFVFGLIILLLGLRTVSRGSDWQTADKLWLATDKVSPSSPANHNNLGDLYFRKKDYQKAIDEFEKAILLKPDYGDVYHNLGNVYKELGDFDKALVVYEKSLTINPNIWPSYQNIAFIYFLDKKYDLALENLEKAIKLQPQRLELIYNLGLIYLSKGEKEKAKEIFEAILQQDPGNQVVKEALRKASE